MRLILQRSASFFTSAIASRVDLALIILVALDLVFLIVAEIAVQALRR